MLEKANEYIRQNHIDEKEKPLFHVTPEAGWMNDPNGFSVYQGKVHLFYQFYPYKTEWGPMHWGHQVTEDLLKWEAYPVAMAPDQDYDHIGCFSGSAVEADGKHVLLYTGVSQKDGKEIQNQCIAIGDGKTYEKWQDNPVIKGDSMPEKFDRKDFRDPKIWKKDGRYYCVVGNRYEENCGQIVLFSSADYKNWRYEKVLLRNDGKNGDMLECPDYLEVDGYPVIICSPQNMHAQKYEFHNGHNSIYIIGDAEKEISDFAWEKKRSLDYGLDFYAPQTTELPDGRRIMVAWMKSWDARVMTKGQKWQGMMTLPRELKIKDGKIWQSPVRELEEYKKNPIIYTEQKISGQMSLDGIDGRVIDMTVELTNVEGREFKVDVAHNEEYTTTFTYYPEKHQIEIDRTYSGGVQATSLLIRNKCDVILHINSIFPDTLPTYGRIRGFEDICNEHHVVHELIQRNLGNTYQETLTQLKNIFNEIEEKYPSQKKGVFLANDTYASMFLNLIFQKYGKLPKDYQIVGFDDSPIASEAILPITTVGQQIEKIAQTAMELLVLQMNEMKKRKPTPLKEPVHKQITPVLIRRDTTE